PLVHLRVRRRPSVPVRASPRKKAVMSLPGKKVVVITGASQGIGAALVEEYGERGYAVVATSRSINPVPAPDVVTVRGDISDRATAVNTHRPLFWFLARSGLTGLTGLAGRRLA